MVQPEINSRQKPHRTMVSAEFTPTNGWSESLAAVQRSCEKRAVPASGKVLEKTKPVALGARSQQLLAAPRPYARGSTETDGALAAGRSDDLLLGVGRTAVKCVPWLLERMSRVPPKFRRRSRIPRTPTPAGVEVPSLEAGKDIPLPASSISTLT